MVFGRNPDKLDQKALAYDQKGKPVKAQKCREKAANLRLKKMESNSNNSSNFSSNRTPARYEQNALKWEQRGNYGKAQKNREKVWRLQNPQYGANCAAPNFYNNNQFIGYNAGMAGTGMTNTCTTGMTNTCTTGAGMVSTNTMAPIVETHVRPTIIEQTARVEKIVEVQPIVHREIDAPQVRVVEKHSYETVPSTGPSVITNAAIVQETVQPRIIEEIQPVVHRQVPAPFVERVEQHVTEHVTQPATMTKQVVQDPTIHTTGMAAGAPMATQQTTTTSTSTSNQGGPLAGVKNAINNITHHGQNR